MSEAKMTSKGQITVPKDVRLKLNLKPGDRVRFVFEANGRVSMRPAKLSISDLKGILPNPGRRFSLEEIDEIVKTAVAKHVLGHDRD